MTQKRSLMEFAGEWQVLRRIVPKSGLSAEFEGRALWSPETDGLAYHEAGMMTVAGHPPMQAEQKYFWARDLSVYFDDGRFFHQVPEAGGQAHHWCDPDSYNVFYDFAAWPRFEVTWNVNGPRKDYRSVTQYTRC